MAVSRRGFLGGLVATGAASVLPVAAKGAEGRLILPDKSEKIITVADERDIELLRNAEDGMMLCQDTEVVQAAMGCTFWGASVEVLRTMPQGKYEEFVKRHLQVNREMGIQDQVRRRVYGDAVADDWDRKYARGD